MLKTNFANKVKDFHELDFSSKKYFMNISLSGNSFAYFSLTIYSVKVSCGNGILTPSCNDCPRTNDNVNSWCAGSCTFDNESKTCLESKSYLSYEVLISLRFIIKEKHLQIIS